VSDFITVAQRFCPTPSARPALHLIRQSYDVADLIVVSLQKNGEVGYAEVASDSVFSFRNARFREYGLSRSFCRSTIDR
jgi:hypothetical protein